MDSDLKYTVMVVWGLIVHEKRLAHASTKTRWSDVSQYCRGQWSLVNWQKIGTDEIAADFVLIRCSRETDGIGKSPPREDVLFCQPESKHEETDSQSVYKEIG